MPVLFAAYLFSQKRSRLGRDWHSNTHNHAANNIIIFISAAVEASQSHQRSMSSLCKIRLPTPFPPSCYARKSYSRNRHQYLPSIILPIIYFMAQKVLYCVILAHAYRQSLLQSHIHLRSLRTDCSTQPPPAARRWNGWTERSLDMEPQRFN